MHKKMKTTSARVQFTGPQISVMKKALKMFKVNITNVDEKREAGIVLLKLTK